MNNFSNRRGRLLATTAVVAMAISSAAVAQTAKSGDTMEAVIVTGTRVQGMTAADSAAPITVLGATALAQASGSTDLRQQMASTIPSFTAQNSEGDAGGLSLSAALRGLSPNDTLILVNGKRRHYSANLHVNGGGFASGSSSADLSMIPSGSIDHVEVLLNGAAAQYGTDAIAGVVNIILKKNSSGGRVSAQAGDYYNHGGSSLGLGNDGSKYDMSLNIGMPLFDKGFVNVTVGRQYQNFTQLGGADSRYLNSSGNPVAQSTVTGVGANGVATIANGNSIPNSLLPYVKGYPRANGQAGIPEWLLTQVMVNAGYDVSDNVHLYAFGSWDHKHGKFNNILRLPNQIITTTGSSQPCTATNLNGYNTAVTGNGVTPACAVGVGGGVTPLGNNGLNSQGIIISSGNAGNLFTSNLFDTNGNRLPSPTGTGTLGTAGELVFAPGGFQPVQAIIEDDYQYNVGGNFTLGGWAIDAGVSYGKDINLNYSLNTANRSLFIDTHTTPKDFYDGAFTASQLVFTVDAEHQYNIGMASPLTVAMGLEAREDFYSISVGDPNAYYKEGAQGFPGFPPAGAIRRSRKNYAGYLDFAAAPIEALQIDVAGRFEHYTDFGDAMIGKITARYDFNPQWAIRGTIATGFRAPTLGEEYYTAVNVSPTTATVQLPANSAAAKLLGLPNLKPEISSSYSVGIVAHLFEDLSATIDAYSIKIGDRIVTSATVNAAGGAINTPLVSQAIALQGVTLDPTATQQGVTAFLNGISTVTEGVDLTANYPTDLGDMGMLSWTLAGNYNYNRVTHVAPPPAVLLASNPNAFFYNEYSVYGFEHQTPTIKVGLTADWQLDEFGVTLRETYYGPQHAFASPNSGGEQITNNQAGVGLTDLELRYNFTESLQLSLGANNLFNVRPGVTGFAPSVCPAPGVNLVTGGSCKLGPDQTTGIAQVASNSQLLYPPKGTAFEPNGGYYYGRIALNF